MGQCLPGTLFRVAIRRLKPFNAPSRGNFWKRCVGIVSSPAAHPFEALVCVAEPVAKLSAQERLVVVLSRKDPLWSLRPRHTHSTLLRFLFGIEAPHSLADRKLEALRRYAVTYRVRDAGVNAAEAAATATGFSHRQLAQVRQMVDGVRAAPSRRTVGDTIRQALFALVALLILSGATAWFSPRFDSSLLSFVFVAVAVLSVASFAAKEPVRR
jgi:hypothetical protein